jgi:hypothetical protein
LRIFNKNRENFKEDAREKDTPDSHFGFQHPGLNSFKPWGYKLLYVESVRFGYNDFSMMMACRLKVAMGNAVPELKEIAHYIAPSVDNDGVADVIERFVL